VFNILWRRDGWKWVSRVRALIEGLSLEIATPDEARQMLNLKGADAVNF
jgi:uncharacterized protein (DUF849 family)